MQCPNCERKTHVYETREVDDTVYRRRHCAPCNDTFVTEEKYTESRSIPSTGRARGRPKKQPTTAAHNPFGL